MQMCLGSTVPVSVASKHRARFKQAHVIGATIEVVGQHIEHAGHQRTPHDRCLFALRIGQLDHPCRRKCFSIFMRDEGQRHRFVVTQREQRAAKLAVFFGVRGLHHCAGIRGQRIGKFVEAVQARDLFHQINLAFHIQTPAGNVDGEIRVPASLRHQLEAQLLKNAENLIGLELLAENAVNFGKTQSHRGQVDLTARPCQSARRPVCLRPIRE